jgi:hypothetical protein
MRIVALALLLLAAPAGAATITLDFEEEPLGLYHPGFLSSECGCVQLHDSRSNGLIHVIDFSLGSRALVIGDEGGVLALDFLVPVFGVQIDFYTLFGVPQVNLGDAWLQLFAGDDLIGEVFVTPDPQGPQVFQTISLTSSVAITRALFGKEDDALTEPVSPLVDNLVLTVPEPAFALGALALAALAARASRRASR